MTRVLSFHADYRCRHSGNCCTAGWPIPDDQGGLLARTERGCAFHNAGSHRCEIHSVHGHDALPLACRQFPRVSLTDPRGASVALSCYCPTAFDMLSADDEPITIVENAPAFPPAGEYVGLDARTSLPPALCPDVLMDWDSWWEWERLSVELCNLDEIAHDVLARLAIAVEHARTWRPGHGELIERIRESHRRARTANLAARTSTAHSEQGTSTAHSEQGTSTAHSARRTAHRFLSCHVFANWTAHLGDGLRTWLRSLQTIVFLIERGWTLKEIDLWLRHYADPRLLARVWSAAEQEPPHPK